MTFAFGRWRGLAALTWGFAEATLFFIVPDVLIGWIALRRGLRPALVAALLAGVGASIGGGFMHAWSAADPKGAARWVEMVPAVPSGAIDRAAEALRRDGLGAALAGSFRGAPYKVWSAAAPACGWGRSGWMLAAFPVRLPRFILVAIGFSLIRRIMRGRITNPAQTALFAAGWTIFYAAFWSLSPW